MDQLSKYIKAFSSIKRGNSKGVLAPHKPVLLLSIIQCIEEKEITENRVFISPELVSRFKDLFSLLGGEASPNFSLPFYHLHTSGFWHLKTVEGREVLLTSSFSIRSFAHLKEVIAFAFFDEPLFQLLIQRESRQILKQCLLQWYFQNIELPTGKQYSLFEKVRTEILKEDPGTYKRSVALADEEERFVRGGVFKRVVPQIYNYTCAISGMRLVSNRDAQMIDACHIVPFAESQDDTISNGLSLCPNLHRAFDRHLISISPDYEVIVSEHFIEESVDYSIRKYHGRKILLPTETNYLPSTHNLAWHHERFLAFNQNNANLYY